jgi:hypothetical protein
MSNETVNKYPELIFDFQFCTGWEDETMKTPIVTGDGMLTVPIGHPFYLIDTADIKIDMEVEFDSHTEVIDKKGLKETPLTPESHLGYYCIFFQFENFPASTHNREDIEKLFVEFTDKMNNYQFD